MSALNDTDQTHVVVQLIGADVVAKIKTVYEHGGHMPDVDAELLEYVQEMFQSDGQVVERLNRNLSSNGVSVTDVREGCIQLTFTCKNVESLRNFQGLKDSGELQNMLHEAFCSRFAEKGLKSLNVVIPANQFEQCAQKFANWIPMTSEHREALLSSVELLVDKITVNEDLLDKLSLCKRRREAIESAATPEEQVKTLIDIVSRQPDCAFTQLLNALNDTQQTEAAHIISRDVETETRSEASELDKTHTTDAPKEVVRNIGNQFTDTSSSSCVDEQLVLPPSPVSVPLPDDSGKLFYFSCCLIPKSPITCISQCELSCDIVPTYISTQQINLIKYKKTYQFTLQCRVRVTKSHGL